MSEGMNWRRWIMLLPAVLFFAVFALFPMIIAVYYSGLSWNGIGAAKWVGTANWTQAMSDGEAWMALRLTIELMVLSWIFQTPISLLIGVFLAGKQRHRAVLGVFYFVPLLFSSVAIGVTWSYILNPNFGLVDSLLKAVGIGNGTENWLGNVHLAMLVVSMIIAWQFIPFHSLLYQSGAKQIPDSLYEAARIDGAGPWSSFIHITIPQLKYTVVTSSVLILTGSLTYFDLIYVLTNGGPGEATTVLAMDMYKQAFANQNIGLGSVLAVILAVAGIVLSILTLRFTGFHRMESQLEGM
ncbi:ABC transporter [Alicyclobacillus hesperidum]|uniref:ABC transporter n=2 Tax=Alicyclobacillus hesperidum TaxID=89784 RepID=A0AA37X3X0_9BACL|nr:sugar ABC transporter permease [Alicyclobacillus hesperidum]GLV13012.1 ABC transporter [Alicyclobacillus hesperidum]